MVYDSICNGFLRAIISLYLVFIPYLRKSMILFVVFPVFRLGTLPSITYLNSHSQWGSPKTTHFVSLTCWFLTAEKKPLRKPVVKKHEGSLTSGVDHDLFRRLRDLYKDAASFPTYGYGLKQVANYMGFSWRDEEIDAMNSAVLYFQYVQNPKNNRDKLEKILDYNEEDCRATKVVKDWLLTHSTETK